MATNQGDAIMLSWIQIGWLVIIPTIGALICAYAAHKKSEPDVTSGYEGEVFNQSFMRNFFLNQNFALFITLMQMYQGHELDLIITLFTIAMFILSWLISRSIPDVPHSIGDSKVMQKYGWIGGILIISLVIFIIVSPTVINLLSPINK